MVMLSVPGPQLQGLTIKGSPELQFDRTPTLGNFGVKTVAFIPPTLVLTTLMTHEFYSIVVQQGVQRLVATFLLNSIHTPTITVE